MEKGKEEGPVDSLEKMHKRLNKILKGNADKGESKKNRQWNYQAVVAILAELGLHCCSDEGTAAMEKSLGLQKEEAK